MIIGIEASHANKIHRTGVENVCFALIQELKKQIPSETKVVLYSNEPLRGERCHSRESGNPRSFHCHSREGGNPGVSDILPPNWSVKILRWPLKKLWSQVRLSLEFIFHPPDIFFAPGQLIPFFCPEKTIVIIHDSAFLAYPEAYNFWGRQYLKWMNRRIIIKAWKIITSSEFNKSEIKKYYGGRAAEKVSVIPFAYDDKKFVCHSRESGNPVANCHSEPRIAVRGKLREESLSVGCHSRESGNPVLEKYNISKPFIISIGRLEKKKNTINIIRAFNILKKTNDIQLLLVGNPGVGYKEIEMELQNSQYKNDIIQLGWVISDDISQLLNQASAFVFPSLYEGFGLPVLEAMACGCPVVAGDLPSLREVGGEAAIYADSTSVDDIARKIIIVLGDEKRIKMQKRGIERAQNFSWSKTVELILSMLSV